MNQRLLQDTLSDTSPVPHTAPLAVTRLSLSNFRNYSGLRIDCDASPVVLFGANGSGKTNLMEAISLLVPGRGMRKAALADLQNIHSPAPWGVAAELHNEVGTMLVGTGRDPESGDNDRRIALVDGKPVRNQQQLAEHIAMAWVTPDMDRILADGT
ncbi:MAG: AAA family ATPase, partial [Alphaproteobacteria bacterium]|nr:AAA family ATPase [Alphaproteobacteria bacterium]